jgi:PAT family acetyl-CoA transporter-like MFS transporter 1
MLLKENILIWRILIIIILYILQGFIQGFKTAIPLFLVSYKASWQQQGTFSWVAYPFSFKILWAPIIDSIYSRRFGRYLTWLIPIQIIIGIILIILSFYLESLLINLQVVTLTIIFFVIYFLIASQDIVVDGWSISLFSSSNLQWSSTCQTIGQVIGQFLGSTVLMTFESSNFTNKYIRKPLSLSQHPYGLFSLQQFTFFWGIVFIIVSIIISIIFFCKKQSNETPNNNILKKIKTKLDLFETYLAILELFKKQCIREFALILFTFGIGFAATHFMTILTLLE